MERETDLHLIVGLGNPGPSYSRNRHNAGFMLAERLARSRHNTGFRLAERLARLARGSDWRREAHSRICTVERCGRQVVLAKPLTYMNLSGRAVKALLKMYPAPLERLLIAYDDFALPLGKIRLRRGGSAGGQKGMRSVIEALGSSEVPRLRIGIGPERPQSDVSEFVLSDFSSEEEPLLEQALDQAVQACDCWLSEGIEQAMAKFN